MGHGRTFAGAPGAAVAAAGAGPLPWAADGEACCADCGGSPKSLAFPIQIGWRKAASDFAGRAAGLLPCACPPNWATHLMVGSTGVWVQLILKKPADVGGCGWGERP